MAGFIDSLVPHLPRDVVARFEAGGFPAILDDLPAIQQALRTLPPEARSALPPTAQHVLAVAESVAPEDARQLVLVASSLGGGGRWWRVV